jgi:hypothetical protein
MIKTVLLTAGTETKVEISGGYNVGVINRTTGMLYASRNSGISAGADDVAAIPAGDSYVIRAADDTVYLLATAAGDVQLESLGAKEVFKVAAARSSSGGGEGDTVDEVARHAIESHASHDEIHLTAAKAIEAAATAISNPNLLINPDLRINQRGKSGTITDTGYFVDGWQLVSGSVTVNPDGTLTLNGTIKQILENAVDSNTTVSANAGTPSYDNSTKTFTLTAAGEIIKWAKLELGSAATPFTPPDPATELAKCQRYYRRVVGQFLPITIKADLMQFHVDDCSDMRVTPSCNFIGDDFNSTSGASVRGLTGAVVDGMSFSVAALNGMNKIVVTTAKTGHSLTRADSSLVVYKANAIEISAEL